MEARKASVLPPRKPSTCAQIDRERDGVEKEREREKRERERESCDFHSKKRRVVENFEELQDAYFRTFGFCFKFIIIIISHHHFPSSKCKKYPPDVQKKTREEVTQKAIDAFLSTHLHPCVKMKEIKTVAVLKHNHQFDFFYFFFIYIFFIHTFLPPPSQKQKEIPKQTTKSDVWASTPQMKS